jgi:hypothetical protein
VATATKPYHDARLRKALLAAAVVALAWTLIVVLSGGIDLWAFGIVFRSRDPLRPAAIALVMSCAVAWLYRVELGAWRRDLRGAGAAIAPWIAAALALVTLVDAIRYGSFVAAGSDSYGYMSQAYGWERLALPRPYAIPLTLPFESGDRIQAPLGHRVGRVPHTMVPTYSPGLPLLMALGILLAGAIGPYLIVPLSAGLFVWATYVLARRVAGAAAGVAAALIAATSPVVLFLSLWVMSDVPAGAAWTGAAACALSNSRRGAFLSAVLSALGILIRPNLVTLALVPFVWILVTSTGRERLVRAAVYAVPVGIAALSIAVLNAYWYGSPLLSGYGDARALYSIHNVWPNLQRYPVWLWRSQSPWIFVAIGAACVPRQGSIGRHVPFVAAVFVVTFLGYVAYAPFDQWWYLRFLLPGLGALFALAAAGIVSIGKRLGRPWGGAIAVSLLAVLVWRSAASAAAFGMFGPFRESEHKYIEVGTFIAREMPPNAVFFAVQHSGSIRYYGGRHTLRYDLLDRQAAYGVPQELERRGLHPYLAVEDAEIPDVRHAFDLPPDRPLPWPYVARSDRFGGISIFDLSAHLPAAGPKLIPHGLGPRYMAPMTIE